MVVSTKGRYALRIMLDLADHAGEGYISLKEISQRQNISLKYMERLLPPLKKNGMVAGMQGKGGGYKLTQEPEMYRVGDILRLMEGHLAPVACLAENGEVCSRIGECRTRPMWEKLDLLINEYFDGITLKDLLEGEEKAKTEDHN